MKQKGVFRIGLSLYLGFEAPKLVKVKAYKRVRNGKVEKVRSHYRAFMALKDACITRLKSLMKRFDNLKWYSTLAGQVARFVLFFSTSGASELSSLQGK